MKKIISVVCTLFVALIITGCSGVEAEKREYPQAIGVDREQNLYQVLFAMPNMQQTTGQDKSSDTNQEALLGFRSKNMEEIVNSYNRTREKYLDLGHVQVLILGPGILRDSYWEELLTVLKEEPMMGEDIYVFYTSDLAEVMKYNGSKVDSLGEYLVGIYENRPYSQRKTGVTLRDIYKNWYDSGQLPKLPEIIINSQEYLEIIGE